MSKEKTIVKLLKANKVIGQSTFLHYMKALDYAKVKCGEGYKCMVLRLVNDKEWVKFYLTPAESL